jgi:hypothetical protein
MYISFRKVDLVPLSENKNSRHEFMGLKPEGEKVALTLDSHIQCKMPFETKWDNQ